MAQGIAVPLFTFDLVFDDQGSQSFLELDRRILGTPRRGATHGGEHAGQHAPLYVVKSIVLGSVAIVDEAFFLASNALENTLLKQSLADSDQVTSFCRSAQRELESS
ncbi:MAG: hypothetical protein A3E51_22540 [Burkholderiales bacterium RIFCSPHIGHO2_12_FULL_67_38]|jgi:hypothetical protein|nr:MAG: hypothetical protein A3I64_14025 [Burkholderiales bacterium RIFCSPLOWO2_02_FULL_67_64]OGB43945.1 MAG: hypothetical protein A3E51_22540 [Burkholderiales bacterium RIFCSPHIGHO2_12_FULL_67_38]OGB94634.1 MAG: hypothetical protein A3G82_12405 [Burkholderiales bacterium RIFCSPLOWO2_12_FULL_67_210]